MRRTFPAKIFCHCIQRNICRHADANLRCINLVYRCRDIETADINQIHRRWCRNSYRRRRYEFAYLAVYLRHDTGERRRQARSFQLRFHQTDFCLADFPGSTRRIAGRLLRAGFPIGLVDGFIGGEIFTLQLIQAIGLALCHVRANAGLRCVGRRRIGLAGCQRQLCQLVVVP